MYLREEYKRANPATHFSEERSQSDNQQLQSAIAKFAPNTSAQDLIEEPTSPLRHTARTWSTEINDNVTRCRSNKHLWITAERVVTPVVIMAEVSADRIQLIPQRLAPSTAGTPNSNKLTPQLQRLAGTPAAGHTAQ
ncbi:Hypp2450 [Branchiostoma lanceolatum]|uniref:Hypp2450 protein n=1 Tax=Branchiostoma lanceolatum TaxID=7740 RepID=A0A8J9ZQN8_BRALA|nr:Hypp2450 [Branchiostoma lanceolatum]